MGCGGSKEALDSAAGADNTEAARPNADPAQKLHQPGAGNIVIDGSKRGAEFAAGLCAQPSTGQLQATELILSENELVDLPMSISVFSALTKLDLSQNHLTQLPPSIGSLVSLQVQLQPNCPAFLHT